MRISNSKSSQQFDSRSGRGWALKMVSIFLNIAAEIGKVFTEYANPVTKEFFLVGSPYQVPVIICAYLLFCLKLGPWYMRNRKPYELNTVIKLHNLIQVLMSLYLLQWCAWRLFFTDYDFKCQQTNLDDKYFLKEAEISYVYFIAKVTELLDTVFFVLRKSFRQVTFLHVFHHTIMPLVCWIGLLLNPGGNAAVLGLFNTAVHVVMYSYYLISSFGDKYKKYLWWKKYVTVFQLVQFAIVGIHSFQSLFHNCGYPVIMKLLILAHSVLFFKMFGDFYVKAYWKKKTSNGTSVKESTQKAGNSYTKKASNGIKTTSNGISEDYTNGKNKSH